MNELSVIASHSQNNLIHHPDFAHGFHLLNHFYSQLLARIYFISTDSLFIGSLFSVLMWAISAMVLIQTLHLLEVEKSGQFKAMAIYSLLPSSILFTGVTLREPFQLLLVNLATFSALKVYLNKSVKFALLLPALVFVMKKFHLSLFVLGLFIISSLLILLIIRKWGTYSIIKGIFISSLIVLTAYLVLPRIGLSNFVPSEKGLPSAINRYLSVGVSYGARTQYLHNIEINGMIDLLLFMPKHFFQYLFEPMPWRVSTALDIIILLENLLRAALIWKVLTGIYHKQTQKMRITLFVFISYLVFEAVWSSGTVNWGTAMRHHVPAMGLLIAAAFAYSKERQKYIYSNPPKKIEAGIGFRTHINTDPDYPR
ncbi:MAG: hypothetical protein H8E32_07245 [Nitrospinae bacterium]|nr:hypothetical protein [Nitrospinota bacterium]